MTSDNQQPEPANVYYDSTRPACLKHGWGHWTKYCPTLQPMSVDENPLYKIYKVIHPESDTSQEELFVRGDPKLMAQLQAINQLIREAVEKERKLCVATMNLMMENVESNLLKSKE